MLQLTSTTANATTLNTEAGSYWLGTNPNSARVEAKHKELVPFMGQADTVHGEILRIASKILFHYHNDGVYWFGEDTEDGFEVNRDTREMLSNLVYLIPKQHYQLATNIQRHLSQGKTLENGELDRLMDVVIMTIDNTDNQNI